MQLLRESSYLPYLRVELNQKVKVRYSGGQKGEWEIWWKSEVKKIGEGIIKKEMLMVEKEV